VSRRGLPNQASVVLDAQKKARGGPSGFAFVVMSDPCRLLELLSSRACGMAWRAERPQVQRVEPGRVTWTMEWPDVIGLLRQSTAENADRIGLDERVA
jgi:hypothetical protein